MTSPFPTAYMPPVSYFALLARRDVLEVETRETFPKQSWRNRCSIATAQGVLDLTIPVVKPYGNRTQTKDVLIDARQKWQNNHWRAIESAYNKSPYFFYFQNKLKELIYSEQASLLE
ncbi:WbqC family protein, partial [Bacteroidales bacterium OttesenSCG-928-J16]|nr:WbqC family protein [Bacteroidales bacterium OttesenSCG-928-J16]